MSRLYKINEVDFNEVYELFKISFPIDEVRPYQKMKRFFMENKLVIYAMKEKNTIIMGLICWEFEDFIFLENFAVHPKYRGKKIGTLTLQEVYQIYNKLMVLEVEKPYDMYSENRIKFYERNGYHLTLYGYNQPPFNDANSIIPLLMMSKPYKINEMTFNRIKKLLFEKVYEKNLD